MNGKPKNSGKFASNWVVVVACVLAAAALGLRFGAHLFIRLRMDKSLKAVPCVDVEALEKAGLDDVQFRAHKIGDFVVYVPADAEEVKEEADLEDEEEGDEKDCSGDDDEDSVRVDMPCDVVASYTVPSLKARLDIVVGEAKCDINVGEANSLAESLLGNTILNGGVGSVGLRAKCLATSSGDFRWSDTPRQVVEFDGRCKVREWMEDTKQYYFERSNGAQVLIEMYSPRKFEMTVECPSKHVCDVTMELEEESPDGVLKCFAFLRRMASFITSPAAH